MSPRPFRRPLILSVPSFRRRLRDDRGDDPGWVLIAVMTAGLVTAIWLVADDQLTALLTRALSSVTQP